MTDMKTRAIGRKLDRIRSLGLEELRLEWRRMYHSDAPRISRDLLVLGLGYRLQEIEQGGLGKATRIAGAEVSDQGPSPGLVKNY
jgi:hypothetical protein